MCASILSDEALLAIGRTKDMQEVADKRLQQYVHKHSALMRILPAQRITKDDLTASKDRSAPHILVEIEKNGRKRPVRIFLDTIHTTKHSIDIEDLRAYDDPGKLFDQLGRDMVNELDSRIINVADVLLIGLGKEVPETGKVQWWSVDDAVNRTSITQAVENVVRLFEPSVIVVGSKFAEDVLSFCCGSVPDELPVEFATLGIIWRVVDDSLIQDGAMYVFGKHEDLGRAYLLQDATAFVDRKAFNVEYGAKLVTGAAVTDVSLCARVDFIRAGERPSRG